jgi:DNA repair exonuclease SbcCD nuclease subunit
VLVVHASDIHLDSPMVGLDKYEGCPIDAIRGATRRALSRLVDAAIEERASLFLIAGDLYDGAWRDYATGLYFVGQMRRLREADVAAVVLRGNHDAESQITRNLRLPDNVRELPTDRAGTLLFESLGVAVHGRGFPTRAVLEDLAKDYPTAHGSLFNIGMLHTALGGREGHEPYAPTSLEVLTGKGYDYWALGHVHRAEVVSREPFVVYPGNLQGRSVKEVGPKGAAFVTVEGGKITRVEQRALDVVRWADVDLVAQPDDAAADVLDRARVALAAAVSEADDRLVAARLRLRGATRAHAQIHRSVEAFVADLRAVGLDAGGESLWLGDVRVGTHAPIDLAALATQPGPISHLLRGVAATRADPEALEELQTAFAELRMKLPEDLLLEPELACLTDAAAMAAALDDIEELLVARLVPDGRDG